MSADVVPVPPAATPGGPAAPPRTAGVGRLFLVELRRFAARAGVRWLVVGMLAVVALTAFEAYRSSRPATPEQRQAAEQAYERDKAQWDQASADQLDSCRQAEQEAQLTDPTADYGCDQMTGPTLDSYLPFQQTFADSASGWVGQVSTFLLFLALVVGATFVAAEFSTGSITTWLTFEPRRGRVFASKVVVVTVATGVVVLVVGLVAVGAFAAVTAANGAIGAVTPQFGVDLGNQVGRLAGAGAFAAALGAGLAFLIRHTAAVIGVVVGWLIVVDGILANAVRRLAGWTTQLNLTAWLQGGTQQDVGVTSCSTDAAGTTTCNGTHLVISMTHGGLVLGVLLAVVTVAALLVFRRRDVA